MKQQEILDYNKRCAEFLGLKRGWWTPQEKPLTEDKKQWLDIDGKTFLGTIPYYDKNLKFYSDWNWIIEVVEAIEKLGCESLTGGSEYYYPEKGMRYIQSFITNEITIYKEAKTKKEAVIQAINQFLIWYNNEQRT